MAAVVVVVPIADTRKKNGSPRQGSRRCFAAVPDEPDS